MATSIAMPRSPMPMLWPVLPPPIAVMRPRPARAWLRSAPVSPSQTTRRPQLPPWMTSQPWSRLATGRCLSSHPATWASLLAHTRPQVCARLDGQAMRGRRVPHCVCVCVCMWPCLPAELGLVKRRRRRRKAAPAVYGSGREYLKRNPRVDDLPPVVEPLDTANVASPEHAATFAALRERADRHLGMVVRQALASAHPVLADPSSEWESVLLNLARRAVQTVEPQGQGDCLVHIKINTIPGGEVSDCEYINGVVCRKNFCYKTLQRTIEHPRILILNDAIQFERTERRIASLNTLQEQEAAYVGFGSRAVRAGCMPGMHRLMVCFAHIRRHTEIIVRKIGAMSPDVLIVGSNVNRGAQELLRDINVACVTNVKPSLLQRLSRLTGATVISSTNYIDKLTPAEAVGSCKRVSLRSFPHPRESEPHYRGRRGRLTYLVVDGCPPSLGCSIILRGASKPVLRQAKAILRWAVYVRHRWQPCGAACSCQACRASRLCVVRGAVGAQICGVQPAPGGIVPVRRGRNCVATAAGPVRTIYAAHYDGAGTLPPVVGAAAAGAAASGADIDA